ncbi:MAG: tripartite tricarboxylate transporter TctB family protein [Gammaproteobacteria bacterium]|nr:tripartite tricarboxylate transporter TctB family protein [Gammaproteobacteria bacterium]
MERLNRDVYIAVVLLVLCGVLFWATFDIRQPDYGVLMPSAWPRTILVALTILSLIYLIQSLRRGRDGAPAEEIEGIAGIEARQPGLIGWILYWRNPLWCFALFLAYLITLPVFGMLIGGVLFVFVLQGVLGGWALRRLAYHAAVALLTVGGMWSVFTYGLDVMLPAGMLFDPFR